MLSPLSVSFFILLFSAWLGWGYDLAHVPSEQQANFIAETRKLFLASTFIIAPIAILAWVHLHRQENQASSELLRAWLQDYPNPRLQQRMLTPGQHRIHGQHVDK